MAVSAVKYHKKHHFPSVTLLEYLYTVAFWLAFSACGNIWNYSCVNIVENESIHIISKLTAYIYMCVCVTGRLIDELVVNSLMAESRGLWM